MFSETTPVFPETSLIVVFQPVIFSHVIPCLVQREYIYKYTCDDGILFLFPDSGIHVAEFRERE